MADSESLPNPNPSFHVTVAMETPSSTSISPELEPASSFSCRICLEDSKIQELVSPCSCSGTCALVHSSCLQRWLKNRVKLTRDSFSYKCEICKSPYKLKISHRPGTFKEYCQDKDERGSVIHDVIALFIFFIASLGAFIITVIHIVKYMKENQVIAFGFGLIWFLVLLVFLVWTYTSINYHEIRWRKWSRENPQVDIKIDMEMKHENQVDISMSSVPVRTFFESGNPLFRQGNSNENSTEALEETGASLSMSEYINHCFEFIETETE